MLQPAQLIPAQNPYTRLGGMSQHMPGEATIQLMAYAMHGILSANIALDTASGDALVSE